MQIRFASLLIVTLFGFSPHTSLYGANTEVSVAPLHEPRNETEAMLQAKFGDKVKPEVYAKWQEHIATKSNEEQEWLRTLEGQLGNFYFPLYLKELFLPGYNPAADAWAHVKDDPALPRVLIIGDSISRAYTSAARAALTGKANVHRAPANCGPTSRFLQNENGELWLMQNSSNKWDAVVVNFGIHDGKSPSGYEERLRKIITRLKHTGAKEIFWVRTTPWGKDATVFEPDAAGDASQITNPISDRVAQEEGLKVIDAHAIMFPLIATDLNRKDFTHWTPAAYESLGKAVAAAVEARLNHTK